MSANEVGPWPDVGVDGRTARSRRTRAAIVDAFVALLDSGQQPTAGQIADAAGVSVRLLWVHFGDFEELLEATAAAVLARQDATFRAVDPRLPLEERIAGFCRQRARRLEAIAPQARASQLREGISPSLRRYRRLHTERVADELRVLFAEELAPLSGAGRASVVASLTSACSWGAWSVLRDDLGLTPARARTAMRQSVTALLEIVSLPPPRQLRPHLRSISQAEPQGEHR